MFDLEIMRLVGLSLMQKRSTRVLGALVRRVLKGTSKHRSIITHHVSNAQNHLKHLMIELAQYNMSYTEVLTGTGKHQSTRSHHLKHLTHLTHSIQGLHGASMSGVLKGTVKVDAAR